MAIPLGLLSGATTSREIPPRRACPAGRRPPIGRACASAPEGRRYLRHSTAIRWHERRSSMRFRPCQLVRGRGAPVAPASRKIPLRRSRRRRWSVGSRPCHLARARGRAGATASRPIPPRRSPGRRGPMGRCIADALNASDS